MVSVMERRKHVRFKHPAGNVSRQAQQRVDARVRDVMTRRDAAATQRRDAHSGQLSPRGAHQFSTGDTRRTALWRSCLEIDGEYGPAR